MRLRALTVGYEGITLDDFISKLETNHVRQLLDVRAVPISRKRGFSKSALQASLERKGIGYKHIPELGSPKEIRNKLKQDGNFDVFFKEYEKHFSKVADKFEELKALASSETSTIMCFEKDWNKCHRKTICEALQNNGFEVVPI